MMNALSDPQLMELQIATLFVLDTRQRLRFVREPGYEEAELDPAPRFFMGRTPQGNTWRFRHDLPDEVVRELEDICQAEPLSTDLTREPYGAPAIRAALEAHAPISREYRGPAYHLPAQAEVHGEVVLVTETNAASLLHVHFPRRVTSRSGFRVGPMTAAVVQGNAVAICFCARITDTAAEAGVETVPAWQGQGHASAAVASWARAIGEGTIPEGAIPGRQRIALYSTEWTNAASRGVARRLGGLQYGEDWSVD